MKPSFVDTCRAGMTCIEDYSDSTMRGMTRFYQALDELAKAPRPVRIAYFGDSFIEADILTADLREMLQFIQKTLCCKNPESNLLEDTELAVYIRKKLNRPIRVCGMVKNIGEAGGGPFLAYNSDGTYSPQILESSQIDV